MDIDNDDLIEAMIKATDPSLEPGIDLQQGRVVYGGDGENVPAEERMPPMIVSHVSSAGYVKIYDLQTGAVSLTNRNMLPRQLTKLNADGKRMFGRRPPLGPDGLPLRPAVAKVPCWLHPEREERPHYDEMGLPVCSGMLLNEHECTMHMRKKHKAQWEAITEEREAIAKAQERELQMAILKAAARGADRTGEPDDIEDDSPRHRGRRARTAVEA